MSALGCDVHMSKRDLCHTQTRVLGVHLHLGVLRTFKFALLPEPLQWEESDYGLSTATQNMGGRSWMFERKWNKSVDSGNEKLVGVRCNQMSS